MGAIGVSFILNKTTADDFAVWLLATWKGYYDPREQLQQLMQGRGLPRRLTASLGYVLEADSDGPAELYIFDDVVTFVLLPISADRLEVRSTCSEFPKLAKYWSFILQAIGSRWPEARPALAAVIGDAESTPDGEHGMESTPAMIGDAESTPAAQGHNFDKDDDIPRFGSCRDLSTREVREIVKRCKVYQDRPGGSAAKFWDSLGIDSESKLPKSFSLGCLNGWLRNSRFS